MLPVTRNGPAPADQIVFPASEPLTLLKVPVSYQTTRLVLHTTLLLAPTASTSRLLSRAAAPPRYSSNGLPMPSKRKPRRSRARRESRSHLQSHGVQPSSWLC